MSFPYPPKESWVDVDRLSNPFEVTVGYNVPVGNGNLGAAINSIHPASFGAFESCTPGGSLGGNVSFGQPDFSDWRGILAAAQGLYELMKCFYTVNGGNLDQNNVGGAPAVARYNNWVNGQLVVGEPVQLFFTIITNGARYGGDSMTAERMLCWYSSSNIIKSGQKDAKEYSPSDGSYRTWYNVDTSKCYSFSLLVNDHPSSYCYTPRTLGASVCNPDTVTGDPVSSCLPMASTTSDASECNIHFTSLSNVLKDIVVTETCRIWPRLNACKCHKALVDPEYKLIKDLPKFVGVPKKCFWDYCDVSDNTQLITTAEFTQTCSQTVCINSQDLDNISESQLDRFEQKMTCIESAGQPGAVGGGSGSQDEQIASLITVIAAVGGGLLGLMILLGIGFAVYRANQNKNQGTQPNKN